MGTGQGPLLLAAPLVFSHDEKVHRRFSHDSGVYVLEPVVEPAKQVLMQLYPGFRTEVNVAGLSRCGSRIRANVGPGPNQKPLAAPGKVASAPVPHGVIGVERSLKENVIPGTDVEHGKGNIFHMAQQVDAPPIGPVSLIIKVLSKVRGGVIQPVHPIIQR